MNPAELNARWNPHRLCPYAHAAFMGLCVTVAAESVSHNPVALVLLPACYLAGRVSVRVLHRNAHRPSVQSAVGWLAGEPERDASHQPAHPQPFPREAVSAHGRTLVPRKRWAAAAFACDLLLVCVALYSALTVWQAPTLYVDSLLPALAVGLAVMLPLAALWYGLHRHAARWHSAHPADSLSAR